MNKFRFHRPRISVFVLLMLVPATGAIAEEKPRFTPPSEDSLPADKFGELVREGKDLFIHTDKLRGKYVGNNLKCVNCHMDAGRHADASPLWAAYTMYPAFRKKTGSVDTFEDRLQGCFKYSMNGKAPPAGSRELVPAPRSTRPMCSRRCGARTRSTGARACIASTPPPALSRPTCRSASRTA